MQKQTVNIEVEMWQHAEIVRNEVQVWSKSSSGSVGAEGVEMERCPGVVAKTVCIYFRGWSRRRKIKIVGTWLRWNYRFVFRCSKRQVRMKKQMQ